MAKNHSQAGLIRLENVTCIFEENAGVFGVNLQVPSGVIFGLIGPSGCGKTTTVRLMAGLYKPDAGRLWVLGETPARFHKHTREQIGYMPQQFVLYPNLTVNENLHFVASLYGLPYFKRNTRLREVLDFVELSEARDRLGGKLSGGMQRRLELACSLVHNPVLLFADEPTAGVDPVLRSKFWEYFRSLRAEGRTLFVTTQYVGEAAYCDLVGVMREGRLLYVDTPQGLRRRAFGGEIIKLRIDPRYSQQCAEIIQRHNAVKGVQLSRRQAGLLYVFVDDAADRLPEVLSALHAFPEITVEEAEEYLPPFDDIFIRLMHLAERNNA